MFNRFDGFGLADWGDGLIFCFSDSSLTGFEFIVFQYETCWCLQSDLVAFRGLETTEFDVIKEKKLV